MPFPASEGQVLSLDLLLVCQECREDLTLIRDLHFKLHITMYFFYFSFTHRHKRGRCIFHRVNGPVFLPVCISRATSKQQSTSWAFRADTEPGQRACRGQGRWAVGLSSGEVQTIYLQSSARMFDPQKLAWHYQVQACRSRRRSPMGPSSRR